MALTLKEQATNFATMRHIERVRNLLNLLVLNLLDRIGVGGAIPEDVDNMTVMDVLMLFAVERPVIGSRRFGPQMESIIRNTVVRLPGLHDDRDTVLLVFVRDLLRRGEEHDQSKLESPEVEMVTEYTDKLAKSTYGSSEYEGFRKAMGPALLHHYAKNSHHPEHFKSGIDDMSMLDIAEMLLDWKASSERHDTGNILKSIEINADRFKMSPQLVKILENTAKMFDS